MTLTIKTVTMWEGRDIETMTRDELIAVVKELGRMHKESEDRAHRRDPNLPYYNLLKRQQWTV